MSYFKCRGDAVRIYKTKSFFHWSSKHEVEDLHLVKAIEEIKVGINVVDLGGYLYKKRIATKGRGKSGSVRTILAYKREEAVFFLHGYEKGEKDNIADLEKNALKKLAKVLLVLTEEQIQKAVTNGEIKEVQYVQKK